MNAYKRWIIPGLIGLTILGLIGFRVLSPLLGGKESSNPATFGSEVKSSGPDADSGKVIGSIRKGDASVASQASTVTVYVSGCVNIPGVYVLRAGARVVDAVASARGLSKKAHPDAVNLAAVVEDGQQIYFPSRKEVAKSGSTTFSSQGGAAAGTLGASGATGRSDGTSTSGAPVDLNTATEEQLDTLPGVGPATAAKIVADRSANGPFGSLDDLSRVSGIGEKKCAALVGLAVAK